MTHRIIDIKTGKPCENENNAPILSAQEIEAYWNKSPVTEAKPLAKSYDEIHAELCDSVKQMMIQAAHILSMLIEIAGRDENLLRSIRWDNFMTIPIALRPIRSKLTWLEEFFKREPRR
jgi:hypothetical protein